MNTFTTTAFGSFVNYNADGAAGAEQYAEQLQLVIHLQIVQILC